MGDESSSSPLPISWDEAREVAIVVLIGSAALMLASPIVGWFDPRIGGTFADDVAMITSNVGSSTSGLCCVTTPIAGRSRPHASSINRTERARPTLTGTTVAGNRTEFRRGRIGRIGSVPAGKIESVIGFANDIRYLRAARSSPRYRSD